MNERPIQYLTLDNALIRLRKLKEKAGDSSPAVVIEGPRTGTWDAVLCQFVLGAASAASVFKGVSRGGRPVVLAVRAEKPSQLLDLDTTIAQLLAFKEQTGSGDVPLLAQSANAREFLLCDFWLVQAGASNVFRTVSRGGQPVIRVAFSPPW